MKNKSLPFLIAVIISVNISAQKLTVPDSILKELKTLQLVSATNKLDTITFKVVYPEGYNASKSYPVLLALSGGNQSESIVNYCYAAWFKSVYFKNHITFLPVNKTKKNLKNYSKEEIQVLYTTIKNNIKTNKNNWIIAGSSNGGGATFNFIAAEPSLFEGAVVMPGSIDEKIKIDNSWKHLNIVLACGEKDDSTWTAATQIAKNKLQGNVKSVKVFMMMGQGHILPLEYTTDLVYDVYFKREDK